jgi:DMSO/TMAO reductase YedYZ molybdopterin-dependent catalytic subunit
MATKLQALFDYLDGLRGRAALDDLVGALARFDLRCEDVAEFIHFADDTYTRNSLRAGSWYHAWILCWKNGQRSPIHDHQGSSCAVRVLRGTLTQTWFEFAPNGHVKATASQDYPAGSVIGAQDGDIHQVSNLQAGQADLITLHIYTPPLARMITYSMMDTSRGEEIWHAERRRMVTSEPENSEMPLEYVRGWVTPNRLFFVRDHFPEPAIELARWRLRIAGCVERPLELSFEDLTAMPERSLFATVECAGNGRSLLRERAPGVQWGAGAIGHAEWTGVPLARVLERAGLKPGTVEILFEGADRGSEPDHPEPMLFSRSLPLAKALHPDTLLVYRMNGELLQPSHGFPLRLFVPGWYGVASVKWLQRIEALSQSYHGYFQSVKYTVQRRGPHGLELEVLGPMAVKSEIIRPQAGAVLGVGTNRIFGIAWAGEEAVADVQVSTDGGVTWEAAGIIGPQAPYSWVLWEYLWEVAEPGHYALLARATSASGREQPCEHESLDGGYRIHHSRPTEVQVESTSRSRAQSGDAYTMLYDMNAFAEEMTRLPLDVEMEFSAGEGI